MRLSNFGMYVAGCRGSVDATTHCVAEVFKIYVVIKIAVLLKFKLSVNIPTEKKHCQNKIIYFTNAGRNQTYEVCSICKSFNF